MCSFFSQVQGLSEQSRDTIRSSPSSETPSFSLQCEQEDRESVQCSRKIVCPGWTDLHTHSLISMATEVCSFSLTMPRFRINVDSLVGAEETDVDTGQAVVSKSVDLSVVSAYLLPQKRINPKYRVPQPLSQPPQLFSIASSLNLSDKMSLLPKGVCALANHFKTL